jgi:hypothetical protein
MMQNQSFGTNASASRSVDPIYLEKTRTWNEQVHELMYNHIQMPHPLANLIVEYADVITLEDRKHGPKPIKSLEDVQLIGINGWLLHNPEHIEKLVLQLYGLIQTCKENVANFNARCHRIPLEIELILKFHRCYIAVGSDMSVKELIKKNTEQSGEDVDAKYVYVDIYLSRHRIWVHQKTHHRQLDFIRILRRPLYAWNARESEPNSVVYVKKREPNLRTGTAYVMENYATGTAEF